MKLEYQKVGDNNFPMFSYPAANRLIGYWGRMRRDYLKEHHPIYFAQLVLSGRFFTVYVLKCYC